MDGLPALIQVNALSISGERVVDVFPPTNRAGGDSTRNHSMINITRRSSSVNHVSRMHRAELCWSLERVRWCSNISFVTSTRKKQMADILAKGSFLYLRGMMGLVNVCAPPSDKISICTLSQGSKHPHKALFSRYVPMFPRRRRHLEHRHDVVKFAYKTTGSKGFLDVDLSRRRERSRCGDYLSRGLREETLASSHQDRSGGQRLCIRTSTANSGERPLAEKRVSTHTWQSVVGRNHNTLDA